MVLYEHSHGEPTSSAVGLHSSQQITATAVHVEPFHTPHGVLVGAHENWAAARLAGRVSRSGVAHATVAVLLRNARRSSV
jgi:hypothetical protein